MTQEIVRGLTDAGRDDSLGRRLASGDGTTGSDALEFAVEVLRHETDADSTVPKEHMAGDRVTSRFQPAPSA